MHSLGTDMMFKCTDLNDSLSQCLKEFPDILLQYGDDKRAKLHENLASSLMTIAAHCRRLKEDIRRAMVTGKTAAHMAGKPLEIPCQARPGHLGERKKMPVQRHPWKLKLSLPPPYLAERGKSKQP